MARDEFFTFRQYMQKEGNALTASAEDYLEMIYRLSYEAGYTRISDLADALNVQPPSVTRMVQKLSEIDLVEYEKYGMVVLSNKGKNIGKFLLDRHNTIEKFLNLLQISEVLDETEKIEHTIDNETLLGIKKLITFFDDNLDIKEKFMVNFKNIESK